MTSNGRLRGLYERGVNRWRRWLGLAVLVAMGAAAIVVLVRDGHRLASYSFHLNPWLALLSFAVECSGLAIAVPVWRQILGRFGGRADFRQDFQFYAYGMLGIAIPGGIWSVVGRAALYEREGVATWRVAAASVVEFILVGLAGLLVYGLATLVHGGESIWQRPLLALGFAILALLLVQPPLFNRMVAWLLRRARYDGERPVTLKYGDLSLWLLGESLVIVIGGAAVYVLLNSLAVVPPGLFAPVVSAWAAAAVAGNLFFWLPGTPVVRDGMMTVILAQSLPPATALVFVLLVRAWTIASILTLAALVWLILGRSGRPVAGNYPLSRGN